MALVTSSSQAFNPRDSLEKAINEFQSILSKDEQKRLHDIKGVPPEQAVMEFTAKLDYTRRSLKGQSVASRVHSALQSVRDFTTAVDTFVSSRPEIAALVWGSIKLTMLIVINYTSYFESLSKMFLKFSGHCPRFSEYQSLYPTSTRLQRALCDFNASIIRCCKHAVEVLQRPGPNQFFRSFWQNFDQEFQPDMADVARFGLDVREEIALAKANADAKEQALQTIHREASSKARLILTRFTSKSEADSEERKRWQLQQDERHKVEQRILLLKRLSSYDHLSPYKEACKMRHPGTAEWIFDTPIFTKWKTSLTSSLLWCSGKIGSGKTIISASAINHILNDNFNASDSCVTFFFVQFDNAVSLKADTILRSILRQSLDSQTLSEEMETSLRNVAAKLYPSLDDWSMVLRQRIEKSKHFYILIDGVDECEPAERGDLLDKLAMLGQQLVGLKMFFTSRDNLPARLQVVLSSASISMTSPAAGRDISLFVAEELAKRRSREDLVVGSESLITDIQTALTGHADGMFLWVKYLIDEICAQHSDAGIRRCLRRLPRDLEATFNRVLLRIVSHENDEIVQRVFPWIAVAKRHLTLEELRDAISLSILQPQFEPEKRINGIEHVAKWCENLILVDEERMTVHFAHHSIKDFITGVNTKPRLPSFRVNTKSADHYCGEICITFLHLNDFQTTLAQRTRPMRAFDPMKIAETALLPNSKWTSSIVRHLTDTSERHEPHAQHDLTGTLASFGRADPEKSFAQLCQSHPFLQYATEHWISHTSNFSSASKTWSHWQNIILEGHALAQTPWSDHDSKTDVSEIFTWSCKVLHKALIRMVSSSGDLPSKRKEHAIGEAVEEGNLEILSFLLEKQDLTSYGDKLLQDASGRGYLQFVERLLTAGADVNNSWSGRTALLAASEGGHVAVVERLLTAGADVNNSWSGRTALLAASGGGHLDVVERLLAAGADVNARPAAAEGQTALQAASEGGNLAVVERLLTAGADVNAEPATWSGRTALQAASGGGHLVVVEWLLAAGADVNAEPAKKEGRTALQAASGGGHLVVVGRLLAAGADVNARPGYQGLTALQVASDWGHLAVVERLKRAGATE